jgi:anaerobic magnesium-protoporphyrin IX monomethyl ester cyclase
MGFKALTREDRLRSYLPLGSLASALMDENFLKKFSDVLGRPELLFQEGGNLPSFDVRVIQLSLRGEVSTEEYLLAFHREALRPPVIVCVTATSAQVEEAREVASVAAKIYPDAVRIIGGPHVSVLPEEYLSQTAFHVACVGEGVETLAELALAVGAGQRPNFSRIQGIAYKDGKGRVKRNPDRKCALSLDDYPFPSASLHLFLEDRDDSTQNQKDIIYILGGYGCPYDCVFCAQRAIHKKGIRERSADNLFREILALYGKGFRKFAVVQETLFNNRKRIERFCHLIETSGLPIEWTAESRADQLEYAFLVQLKKAGLRFIQIGLESGDQKLLDTIGKRVRLDQVQRLRGWLEDLKIDTAFYLLVGLPGQDWQSILRSALFLIRNVPYNRVTMHVSTSIAIPYPGTRIYTEGAVRMLDSGRDGLNWASRNPKLTVSESGEFVGVNFTETDAMTAGEILESQMYLDDFCHFILHAKFDRSFTSADRWKAWDYACRILYMIERRTIRDLIVRAEEDLSPQDRSRNYEGILERDMGEEIHFRDVICHAESSSDLFRSFLSSVSFRNGYSTMKALSIQNRIKWMRVCSLLWGLEKRRFDGIRFSPESFQDGENLNRILDALDMNRLHLLPEVSESTEETSPSTGFWIGDEEILKGHLNWRVYQESSLLEIDTHALM